MTSILGRIFGSPPDEDDSYARAMNASDELIARMREASNSTDPARAIMADVWAHNHNIPFLTTVGEAVQEMKSGTNQKPTDR